MRTRRSAPRGRWVAIVLPLVLWLCLNAADDLGAAVRQEEERSAWLGESYEQDGAMIIPLKISDLSGVVAIDLNLVYAAASFPGVDVRGTSLLNGFLVMGNTVVDTLKVAIAGFTPASGSGAFVEIVVPGRRVPELGILRLSLNAPDGDLIPVTFSRWVDPDTSRVTVVTAGHNAEVTSGSTPLSCYPNPFNASTTIAFGLPRATWVRLAVYDTLGQSVRLLVNGACVEGTHRVVWDGRNGAGHAVASGRYVAVLKAEGNAQRMGLVLVR